MARKVADNARDDIRYFGTLSENGREAMAGEAQRDIQIMAQMAIATINAGDAATTDYIMKHLQSVAGSSAIAPGTVNQVIQELQGMRNAQQQQQQQVVLPDNR
jgi:hypothetical protein